MGSEHSAEVPFGQRRFMLTPLDLVLTMDLLLVVFAAGGVLN